MKNPFAVMNIVDIKWVLSVCSGAMSQGGLKHAATESRLDSKRERRRGAAGRASVLRRAPSDSDCSGETASLSADSGDRAVRPAPPPARTGKSRSRRRGSEWEVLEGLKDGQRFEKRPDVFNGYLHKKRKWPLKGWHKRYFVVDGGILVYARSPTDVARGRLHGSVDVGLSVISAKARRRRIDIDADEFIYHLRAKTPDVFRTWLNVLKAHRLYRQHLLTFGARESIPKIHAPLEDLPPTDTSSRSSCMSVTTTESTSSEDLMRLKSHSIIRSEMPICTVMNTSFDKFSIINFHKPKEDTDCLTSTNYVTSDDKLEEINQIDEAMCFIDDTIRKIIPDSVETNYSTADNLTYMNSTDNVNKDNSKVSKVYDEYKSVEDETTSDMNHDNDKKYDQKFESIYVASETPRSRTNMDILREIKENTFETDASIFRKNKIEPTPAYFFFARRRCFREFDHMKRSKKCTNLVKYKNLIEEPKLQRPLSKCMLLGKLSTVKISKQVKADDLSKCDKASGHEISNSILKKHESVSVLLGNKEFKHASIQDTVSVAEYSDVVEKILLSLFENHNPQSTGSHEYVKTYVNKIVEELYDVKLHHSDINPIKTLFRCLLEFWLKHNTKGAFKNVTKGNKSIGPSGPNSHSHIGVDKEISSIRISLTSRGTQYQLAYGIRPPQHRKGSETSKLVGKPPKVKREKLKPPCHSPRRDTESFEKERRIQELERLLKNTVYLCENVRSLESKEKDVRITKTLLDNIGMLSAKSNLYTSDDMNESSSSAEIPRIQETINHLISDTEMPPDVAKDFLNAYLGVLDDTSKSITENSTSHSGDTVGKPSELDCDVQTEAVQKKMSKSILTDYSNKAYMAKDKRVIDPGQQYLKDILDKVTTIFSKINSDRGPTDNDTKAKAQSKPKDELGRSVKDYLETNLVREDYDSNSVIIDLSKYNLEHISMFNDPVAKGVMSITIKLKEKPQNHGEAQRTHLNLKFSDETFQTTQQSAESKTWMNLSSCSSSRIFETRKKTCKHDILDFNCKNQLKPYLSTCDIGSKSICGTAPESENSIDLSFKSSKFYQHYKREEKKNDDPQSCYIMSFQKKKIPSSPTQVKKRVRLKECHGLILNSLTNASIKQKSKYPDEYGIFERPAPKIIDEKFILLLLENLTFLSKDIPGLHKEINNLYLKLKKKHEKVVKNCINIQGLSLLGKIYNDDNGDITQACSSKDMKSTRNIAINTNYELNKTTAQTNTSVLKLDKANTATNTSDILKNAVSTNTNVRDNSSNKDLCSKKNTRNAEMVTEAFIIEIKSLNKFGSPKKSFLLNESTSSTQTMHNNASSRDEFDLTDHATSGQNWHRKAQTKDCGVTTVIKCILNNASNKQKNFVNLMTDLEISAPMKRKKELLQGVKRDFVSCYLSSHFKVATPSMPRKDLRFYELSPNNEVDFDFGSDCSEVTKWRSEIKLLYKCRSEPSFTSESGGPLENASRELGQAQLSVQQLQRLLDALELQQQVHHDTDVSLEGASPNVKKDRRKFGLRKKKSNSKCASVELTSQHIDPSTSHMALSALTAPPSPGGGASSIPTSAASLPIAFLSTFLASTLVPCAAARPQSLPGAEALAAGNNAGPASLTSLTPDHQLREDFTVLAKDLVASLKTIVSTLVCERGRLRAAMDAADSATAPPGAVVAALRTNLTSALQQNSVLSAELRTRLSRIHDASDLAEISTMERNDSVVRQFQQSLSYSSSCVSASEFFDAEEHEDVAKPEAIIQADEAGVIELDGDSSSEAGSLSSEEGSASSENSDVPSVEQPTLRLNQNGISDSGAWSRRTRLPCPRPTPGGPSLWNLLYKNIGKDLSQVSMPVTINEPLNMLQRLCEELEYSELLDSAAECSNAIERMSLMAAFAVSAYASSAHRAASKPFNPLLAESYECVRDDKGFRFIAEQVSHHPPISACHAESTRWRFWQEARIKTKFWGKSMEFQPAGRVHVKLLTTGDHYSWNKVTTCVHNLFGGQRWVDQYGDMHITCHGTDITCKLNFIKASSWSSTRHEVRGAVVEGNTGSRLRVQGRWSEALYAGEPPAARCLWRPGAMPPEHELYYGFTRFAMELNEMEPGMKEVLPYTDTRLRPDQRALEEGDVDAAEGFKHQLEQSQRERRRDAANHQPAWFRKTCEGGEEMWIFTGEYWKARGAGFPGLRAPRIW
ncbi:uncharacterized protein LOC128679540 isoform X2 [Plodia interpunctella]|uniref:uncharacterized protein LOC128679540 isoform X2 n=1 Tax=Plodia interpunctella TaxID=58824 RepID=UPI002368B90C|nr:uncharacterized protein LOC128679540 isoform X2 [Plodia interpunctella]